ncbi:hypothetical protein NNC19_08190 [Clostridium sp. SHJSY1]|uniref:exo-rhamnogalacturonan lyase family protein n=1 Tax=Clostridium sp. SHJSY1 TaxID=2942483 RepID=UPI00287644E8|nr:hypothetical protein [Clostridium sp. SHJSY1]MDS0525654.1 hypothetical protein [Clostridium sp. SHJSY1]
MPKVKWLDELPKSKCNVTWGMPWEKGELKKGDNLTIRNKNGEDLSLQSWPLAYWPDGSIKWSAQSAIFDGNSDKTYEVIKISEPLNHKSFIKIKEDENSITVDTTKMICKVNKNGQDIIEEVLIDGKRVNAGGRLVAINELRDKDTRKYEKYYSKIENVEIEQEGPLRVVIKVSGVHENKIREWLPFTIRLTFSLGLSDFKITHTFFYDGNPETDFIKGLGLEFKLNLHGNDFNKHVRFALEEGIYSEPAKLLLTRFYHKENKEYEKQINGEFVNIDKADKGLVEAAEQNAIWNDFKLVQDSANHYKIIKRSDEGLSYIDVIHGNRANGLMYIGAENCGLALGLKNFWQRFPSALEVTKLAGEETRATLWLWDTSVQSMDLRHYSNNHHMVAYEGFEEIRSTPVGIANTSDIYISCYSGLESNTKLKDIAKEWQNNSLLICEPEYYYNTKAAGKWGLQDKKNELKKFFEEQLDNNFEFYKNEVEQRSWYGYWNYGDVMHTYDGVRHQWRYDLGGYAWQNTELVPNIWLWYQFFRTGNRDVFKMAEAMTRHNSEVDVYHFGNYKGLGSRHNVIHWGCSCKEIRINMAILHKYYYYLTADERLGELLSEMKDADKATEELEPLRGFFPNSKLKTHIRTGPDWSAFCSNWEAEWERNENEEYKNKILVGLENIKELPMRLLSTPACGYDAKSSRLTHLDERATGEYHMMISFGAPQIWIEIAELLEDETFKDMISEFGEFYMLSDDEKRKRTNGKLSNKCFSWPMFATGMVAYASNRNKNPKLAEKAWRLLFKELNQDTKKMISIDSINSWKRIVEDPKVTTNCVSQWSINVIMCLELIGDMIPEDLIKI